MFQSPIMMSPRIIDTIKQDHRELETYYNHITKSSDKDDQTRYQNQFTWELARHSIGEELVVYPAFEKYLCNGIALADKDRQEHQSVSIPTLCLPFNLFISVASKIQLGPTNAFPKLNRLKNN